MLDALAFRDLRLSRLGKRSGAFNPATLFGTTDTGWIYDLSDMSTLFQDAAGTTPVTAFGQPMGLNLDKSKGLVLGPELVTNGDFSNGATGWTFGTNWTISGGAATTTGANSDNITGRPLTQSSTLVVGRLYEVSVELVANNFTGTSCVLRFQDALNANLNILTVTPSTPLGVYRARIVAVGPNIVITSSSASPAGSFTIDNISVRELPGNHSSQSTPSFRGVLQGSPSRLVLDGSDDRYVTTLNPTASGTIAARIRGATASRVVAGSQGATDGRALLALAADGSIAAGIGAQSTAVIKGTVDKRNVWVTACVTWNGTTVRLYEDGVEVYSGAQSGAVNTTVPFIYGALNANGTASAFWDDDIGASLVISRAITATEAVQLHNAWRNIA